MRHLRHLLLEAAFLDQERVRQVIEFIVVERPEQISEVRDACIEVTLRELEQRNDLRGISTFERWLKTCFRREPGLLMLTGTLHLNISVTSVALAPGIIAH